SEQSYLHHKAPPSCVEASLSQAVQVVDQVSSSRSTFRALMRASACSNSTASLVQCCARLRNVFFDSSLVASLARSAQFSACCRHSFGSPGTTFVPPRTKSTL